MAFRGKAIILVLLLVALTSRAFASNTIQSQRRESLRGQKRHIVKELASSDSSEDSKNGKKMRGKKGTSKTNKNRASATASAGRDKNPYPNIKSHGSMISIGGYSTSTNAPVYVDTLSPKERPAMDVSAASQ
jgi:hypothetical protein